MTCARVRQMLDALVDRELDTATDRELEAHLIACPECARLRAERVALRERMRAGAPYFAAPARIRNAVGNAVAEADGARQRPVKRPTWIKTALVAASAAVASLVAGIWIGRPPLDDARRESAVASHVASLAPQRQLIEVASTDRHAVKPWFSGKVDFSPPVHDLASEGFALAGARLDHVGDRQAAAIVYRVRSHDINLFVWRAAAEGRREETTLSVVRGFGVATWAQDGLRFAAVSDLELQDLKRFAELVREAR